MHFKCSQLQMIDFLWRWIRYEWLLLWSHWTQLHDDHDDPWIWLVTLDHVRKLATSFIAWRFFGKHNPWPLGTWYTTRPCPWGWKGKCPSPELGTFAGNVGFAQQQPVTMQIGSGECLPLSCCWPNFLLILGMATYRVLQWSCPGYVGGALHENLLHHSIWWLYSGIGFQHRCFTVAMSAWDSPRGWQCSEVMQLLSNDVWQILFAMAPWHPDFVWVFKPAKTWCRQLSAFAYCLKELSLT